MSEQKGNLFVLKSMLTTTITKPSSDNSLRSLITLPISPIPLAINKYITRWNATSFTLNRVKAETSQYQR